MTRTIIIRREYLHFIPKYSRYEKRWASIISSIPASPTALLAYLLRLLISLAGIKTLLSTALLHSVWKSETKSLLDNADLYPR
jgi:hypothetical protein